MAEIIIEERTYNPDYSWKHITSLSRYIKQLTDLARTDQQIARQCLGVLYRTIDGIKINPKMSNYFAQLCAEINNYELFPLILDESKTFDLCVAAVIYQSTYYIYRPSSIIKYIPFKKLNIDLEKFYSALPDRFYSSYPKKLITKNVALKMLQIPKNIKYLPKKFRNYEFYSEFMLGVKYSYYIHFNVILHDLIRVDTPIDKIRELCLTSLKQNDRVLLGIINIIHINKWKKISGKTISIADIFDTSFIDQIFSTAINYDVSMVMYLPSAKYKKTKYISTNITKTYEYCLDIIKKGVGISILFMIPHYYMREELLKIAIQNALWNNKHVPQKLKTLRIILCALQRNNAANKRLIDESIKTGYSINNGEKIESYICGYETQLPYYLTNKINNNLQKIATKYLNMRKIFCAKYFQ